MPEGNEARVPCPTRIEVNVDTVDIVIRLLILAIVAVAIFGAFRRIFSTPISKAEKWSAPPPAWSELKDEKGEPRPWTERSEDDAREIHIKHLMRLIYFHSRGGTVKTAQHEKNWRVWIDTESFSDAGLMRAEWNTKAGALRKLLNTVLTHGGAWQRRDAVQTEAKSSAA